MGKMWLLKLWECEEFDHMKLSADKEQLKTWAKNNCGVRRDIITFRPIGADAFLVLRQGREIGIIGQVTVV